MFGLERETLLLPLEESLQRRRQTLCKDKSFSEAFRRLRVCELHVWWCRTKPKHASDLARAVEKAVFPRYDR